MILSRDRKFVRRVCEVPNPSQHFRMDEYSETLIVSRPLVYISLGELLNTHKVRIHMHSVNACRATRVIDVVAFSCCWSTAMLCVPSPRTSSDFCSPMSVLFQPYRSLWVLRLRQPQVLTSPR